MLWQSGIKFCYAALENRISGSRKGKLNAFTK